MRLKSAVFLFLLCLPVLLTGQHLLALKEIRFVFESKEVSGTIGDFRSSSEINLEKPEYSSFKGSVGVGSLKTGNFLRDWALKGRKYFNENQYPRIVFESTEVIKTTEGITAKGQLTMKGIILPLTIVFKRDENVLSGKAELYTSDYDIFIKKKREENKVEITLEFLLE